MRVARWGNSLAVRLPSSVVELLELKEGDEITIHVEGERAFAVERDRSRAKLLDKLSAFRGRLPDDFIFDRNAANER